MRESCYCGRAGEVEDRDPAYESDRVEALRCPRCGHLDPLPQLDDDAATRCSMRPSGGR